MSAGAGGVAGAAGNGGVGGGVTEVCPIVYVANKVPPGSGCRSDAPVGTLVDAFAALAKHPEATEIRLCNGDYVEGDLQVPRPVKIIGSWDCSNAAAWAPTPNVEENNPQTKITRNGETGIVFHGSTHLPNTSQLERIKLVMNPATTGKATGILVTGTASPRLHHLNVSFNGQKDSEGDAYGSAALTIAAESAAKVEDNVFRGGEGKATDPRGVGSVGVYVVSPAGGFFFRNNDVRGGKGTTNLPDAHGSAGMVLEMGSHDVTLEDNESLDGGTGSSTHGGATRALVSVGLLVRRTNTSSNAPTTVKVTRSSLSGGTTDSCGTACQTRALYLQLAKDDVPIRLIVERSRLYGGDPQPSTAGGGVSRASSEALRAERSKVQVVSSLLHGGGAEGANAGDAKTTYTTAVSLVGGELDGSFVTLLPGRHASGGGPTESALTANSAAFRLHWDGQKPSVSLADSLIVASARQTYGVYGAGGDVCAGGYKLKLRRVRHFHTESVVSPVQDQVGFYGGESGPCPQALRLESIGFPVATNHEIDPVDAEHVYGGGAGPGEDPFRIHDCVTSNKCENWLFDGLDLGKGPRAAILASGSSAYVPRCNAGAGINTLATQDGKEDLRGIVRGTNAAKTLGALTRDADQCPSP